MARPRAAQSELNRVHANPGIDLLARVREAIQHAPAWSLHPPATVPAAPAWGEDERVKRFTAALTAVGGRVSCPTDDMQTRAKLVEIVQNHRARRIAWISAPALEDIGAWEELGRLDLELRSMDFAEWVGENGDTDRARGALRHFLSSADLVISGADYAIADTGTLVLVAGAANPRSATNLPPVHVAVIRPAQIVSTLADLVPVLRDEAGRASCTMLVTGPSRTSDIEQISTIGVHGPIELDVILRP